MHASRHESRQAGKQAFFSRLPGRETTALALMLAVVSGQPAPAPSFLLSFTEGFPSSSNEHTPGQVFWGCLLKSSQLYTFLSCPAPSSPAAGTPHLPGCPGLAFHPSFSYFNVSSLPWAPNCTHARRVGKSGLSSLTREVQEGVSLGSQSWLCVPFTGGAATGWGGVGELSL